MKSALRDLGERLYLLAGTLLHLAVWQATAAAEDRRQARVRRAAQRVVRRPS